MSRPTPIPEPLDCVLFDAGDRLVAPAPSFQGRFADAARAAGIIPVLVDRFARYSQPNGIQRIESLLGLVELVSGNGSG
jgi:hypothetical protein